MASMRDIQRRRNSIASTQQITKAMKLVSTVKLQRTREKAEECKPYFNHMYATVTSMLARTGIVEHPYLKSGKSGKKGVIVISSNRGLAGGYNSNIVKMLTQGELEGKELLIYNIGRKGHEALERKGYEIAEDYSEVINSPLYSDAVEISQRVLKDFEEEKIGEIYLVYTSFKNTVVHEPKLLKLLPVEFSDKELSDAERNTPMNYKPGEEEALDMIIPKYIASLVRSVKRGGSQRKRCTYAGNGCSYEQCRGHDGKPGTAVQPCKTGLDHAGADRDHCRSRGC